MRRFTLAVMVVLLVSVAAPARAQSLFATRGLGLPVAPVDARARALGGIGVGLLGLNTSLVNPAALASLTRRGVSAALQPQSGSAELNGNEDGIGGTRFPLIRILYPFSERVVGSIGYGGLLDQSWAVSTEGVEHVGDSDLATRDVVESSGAVAQLALGMSYRITPSLAIGAGGGVYTGNLDRRVTRTFTDTAADLQTFTTRLRWNYNGPFGVVGARWDPVATVRLGASLTLNGKLDITRTEGEAEDAEARIPYRLNAGGSALINADLMAAFGAEYAWRSGQDEPIFEDQSSAALRRDVWRLGGGIEYGGVSSGDRAFPVRLGASYSQLPYYNSGETPAHEWSGSLGIGVRLAGDEASPAAVLDATIERGGRSGLESQINPDGLSESFWRFTFSLSLFGR